MPLITSAGIIESQPIDFLSTDALATQTDNIALDLPNDADISTLHEHFDRIHTMRIAFPATADGRGFSLAQQLRNEGYVGKLRAHGPLISDQFRYALACGFNEVETTQEIVDRQPAKHWHAANDDISYRDKLAVAPALKELPENVTRQQVIDVKHYTDSLFSFRIKRPESFRFNAGEFVMLGIEHDDKTTFRAYSICSATWDDYLEFYSIKVPTGEFTKRLQWIRPGDSILLKSKSTGSLVTTAITPGSRLFMHATGTGLAPFLSLIQEPELYDQFDSIVLTHTCRTTPELQYGKECVEFAKAHEMIGEEVSSKLMYLGSTTRESQDNNARITQLIESGALYEQLDIALPNPESDRVLVCGSKAVNLDMRDLFQTMGFTQGSLNEPGSFVWERAFVD